MYKSNETMSVKYFDNYDSSSKLLFPTLTVADVQLISLISRDKRIRTEKRDSSDGLSAASCAPVPVINVTIPRRTGGKEGPCRRLSGGKRHNPTD